MLRFGPDEGPVVVMALPLFEEANRTRAFGVSIMRALAERGVAGALPDLPGTGESLVPFETLTMLRVQQGYEGAVDHLLGERRNAYGVGIRSGALLDSLGLLSGRWHLAPQPGPDLLRELTRIKQADVEGERSVGERSVGERSVGELRDSDGNVNLDDAQPPIEVAGHRIAPAFLAGLTVTGPFSAEFGVPVRTVRLATDPQPADLKIAGTPLWRRAEPGNDLGLAQSLADHIARWVRACEGC